jgi:hypothetical protein
LVHISNINSMGASKLRLMTNFSSPEDSFARYSASRSQVASPPAFLTNLRVSSAASGVGSVIVMSIFVLPFSSEKTTVTRNSGGRSS